LAFAGTDDKLSWLKNELGADHAFNYKGADLDGIFKKSAPEGIDCYFDNVSRSLLVKNVPSCYEYFSQSDSF
jgi:NADPH-dependent curcumin reductase CurA